MNTIKLLKSIGLFNYEAEVYAALLKVDRAKVHDLTKLTSVPRPMIYLTLKKLVNKGMCIENKGKVSLYSASAPLVAFQNVLQIEKETLQNKIKKIRELNNIYKTQEKTEVPFEFIQVLKGRQIREFIIRTVNEAKKEMLMFTKYFTEQNEKAMEGAVEVEIKALKKGIKARCLYETKCLKHSKFLPYCKKALNHGEIGRVIDFLPMNMLIIDEKATFSLTHKDEKDVTVFVFNHPALASAMKGSFEHFWSKGTDINKILTKVGDKYV
jgi:sugar-specific transcriptional regulator TrmB